MPVRASIVETAALAMLVLLSGPAPSQGRDADGTPEPPPDTLSYRMPEIVVTASRLGPRDDLLDRSGFVARVELGNRKERLEDVAAVLSRVVGVRVRSYGGLGGFATASIRGSASNQVNLYLDGVPLGDAYSGMGSLADLPIGGIERIEIFRGFSPTHFGSSAIGGTVNLVSSGAGDRPGSGAARRIESYNSTGSFGTSRHLLSLRSSLGPARLLGHGGFTRSAGDFTFTDDNATPANPDDDETAVRINNDHTMWNLIARAEAGLPGIESLSINHNVVHREGGISGPGSDQSTRARFERRRHITYLKLRAQASAAARLAVEGNGFYSWTAERFLDPEGEVTPARQDTDNRIVMHGGNARLRLEPPVPPVTLDAFFESRKERFHPSSALPTPRSGPDYLRHSWTLALSFDISLFDDRLVFTPGARHEWIENEFYDPPFMPWLPPSPQGRIRRDERTPSLGLRLSPRHWLTIKGNWGRYYRVPTFVELFGNTGNVTGDATLEPEKGTNGDIGLVVAARRIGPIGNPYLEAVFLDNEVENLIIFFQNSQSTVKPRNIGAARIRGFETALSFTVLGWIHTSGNYCLLDSRDTSEIPYYNGNELPGRPRHEWTAQLELRRRWWSASYELHHIGPNYLDRANMKEAPGRDIHGAALSCTLPDDNLSLTVEGRNLTDDRIVDVSGYPLPGRSFYVTLKLCI